MPLPDGLLKLIRRVITELPPAVVGELVRTLETAGLERNSMRQKLLGAAPTPGGRHLVRMLMEEWESGSDGITAASLAAALASASYSQKAAEEDLSVQLIWTGPTEDVPLRMTSQALLQLIDGAERDLLIVSFAVYDIPEIVEALSKAIIRGVRLVFVAETPDESKGKVSFGALPALGDLLIKQSQIYIWPKEKRRLDSKGRHGSLHVKCAVADDTTTYITSANLTGYAMRLNMEMGVLIRNCNLARQVTQHIQGLINQGDLVRI